MTGMTRRGFLAGTAAATAGAVLLPAATQASTHASTGKPGDVAGHLAKFCAPQIRAIRTHPWIRGAAHDTLTDAQIGSWATQDLLWFPWIQPAYTTGFAGAPPAALAAQAWLAGNDARETAFLEATSKNFRNAPGAGQLWPGFLGYGAYGGLIGTQEASQPAPHIRSLIVIWVAEYAYHQAWLVVLGAHPRQEWARFGGNNWGGQAFATGNVANLSAGLNAAVAAGHAPPMADMEALARQMFLWEHQAWTDCWECDGWNL